MQVINNSWGTHNQLLSTTARWYYPAGTNGNQEAKSVVVFAGNDNRGYWGWTCGIEGNLFHYRQWTSNCLYQLRSGCGYWAPATFLSNESLTTNFGGTSAAAPVVSGLAGWILSVDPDLTSGEVVDLIVQTAEQSPLITPDETGHHDKYGYGVVSPSNIHTTFFPTDMEEPSKGGCNTLANIPSSVMFSHLFPLLFGWIAWVRRRWFYYWQQWLQWLKQMSGNAFEVGLPTK